MGEAEGVVDDTYHYMPAVLANQTASAEVMWQTAWAAAGVAQRSDLADPALRAALVDELVIVLRRLGGLSEVQPHEVAFLNSTVALYDADPSSGYSFEYGLYRALGSIISARARLGWSTLAIRARMSRSTPTARAPRSSTA